MSNSNNCDIGL